VAAAGLRLAAFFVGSWFGGSGILLTLPGRRTAKRNELTD